LKSNYRKLIFKGAKIIITLVLIYYVFDQIPFFQVIEVLKQSNLFYLFLGLLTFVLSQFISAVRLLQFFHKLGYHLSAKSNYYLYIIGMFYNFFIPGGIGGDAYKVFLLNKHFNWSAKKLTSAVFVDRIMGLTAIGVLLVIGVFFVKQVTSIPYLKLVLPVLLSLGVLFSYFFVTRLFKVFKCVFSLTLVQSIMVQLLQCISLVCILYAIDNTFENWIIYVLVFLISSVLSIFSFAGIGVREIIFFKAAEWFVFNEAMSLSVALIFSIYTALVSFFGIYFIFRKVPLVLKTN